MNFSLTPEEKEKIENQKHNTTKQLIESGRTEKEVKTLLDSSSRRPFLSDEYQPLYTKDIFKVPTLENCEISIVEIRNNYINTSALICELENYDSKAILYISALYRKVIDINGVLQYAQIIGMENLGQEIENTKGSIINKIRRFCEIAGGKKFELVEKIEIVPYDRNKSISTVDKFRLLS